MPIAARIAFESSVPGLQRAVKPMSTKNAVSNDSDELRPEYDLSTLAGGVRGKYYEQATAGTTLVLLDRDVAEAFPDGRTVNEALRALMKVAQTHVRKARQRRKLPIKALQPASRAQRKAKSSKGVRATRG